MGVRFTIAAALLCAVFVARVAGFNPGSKDPGLHFVQKTTRDKVFDKAQATRGAELYVKYCDRCHDPAKVPEGKVIHVPYTELLNADGTPKAAKDIWNTLVKAGVPRYAEIISISDEPGEAAANYFILKLMGYPDVKVLVM